MKLNQLLLVALFIVSINLSSQSTYDNLPINQKILIKQGTLSFPIGSSQRPGNPTPQATGPEQQCNSAIPVCQNIYSTSVSYTGEGSSQEIPGNTCLGSNERNSVWYTFTSSTAGNIAFNITPNVSSQDYDFALYNLTGNNCSSISSGALTPVRCNFAASGGVTGLSPSGTNASEPASGSNQSTVLATTVGQTYVLIISNYSSSANGYQLNFTPGTASIFDVTPPTLTSVTAPCGSSVLTLNTSEQIRCSSIAANGSDLTLTGSGGPYVITSATGVNCGANTGQINFTCSPPISGPGPWTIGVVTGSDGNTLIDACGNAMVVQTRTFTTSPPVVTITGPTSVCKGTIFALTSSAASSYTWSGAAVPGGQQNNQSISITANTPGTLNFNLVVTNGTCGNGNATQAVTVIDAPIANFSALPSLTVCAGSPITFTNTSTYPCSNGLFPSGPGLGLNICNCGSFACYTTPSQNANARYLWTFGNGATAFFILGNPPSAFSPVYTYTAPGNYVVSLTASSLSNNCSNSRNLTITVLPSAANVTISPSQVICAGQSATLTATGGTAYTWSPSSTLNTPNGGIVIATPVATTTYVVSYPGCSGTNTLSTVVSLSGAPPSIGAVAGATAVCSGQSGVIYSVNNVAATTYAWVLPAGASISSAPTNSNAISVNFGSTAGTISVTATTACGSTVVTLPITFTVAAPAIGPIQGLTQVCANQTGVTYSVTNIGGVTYAWVVPAGVSITSAPTNSNAITVNYGATAGTFTVIASTACGTTIASVLVNITAAPSLVMPPNATVCPSSTVTLSVSGGGTYTWSPAGSLSSANGNTVTSVPLATTIYTVSSLACGSPVTGTVEIVVDGSPPNLGLMQGQFIMCPNERTGQTYSVTNYPAAIYNWSVPSGATITSGANTNMATVNFGASTGSLIVTAVSACGSATSIATVVFPNSPTITVSPNTSICPSNSVTLSAGGAATFTWNPGGIVSQNISVSPSSTTIYTVTGFDNVCSNTNTVQVIANANPTITVSPNFTVCPGTAHTFSATGAANYTWTPNIFLNSAFLGTVISTPTANTIYTINGATGTCTGSATVNIAVINTVVVVASTNSTIICPLGNALLTASGANTYVWSPAISLSSNTGSIVTASPVNTATYNVIGSSGTCTNSAQVIVTVTTTPVLVISPSANICAGSTAALNVSGANTYTWSPATGLNTTTGGLVNANPNVTTTYTVNATSAVGCRSFSTVVVNVTPIPNIALTSNPSSICSGSTSVLAASGSATGSYTWSPAGSLSSANGNIVTASPAVTTVYTVIGTNGNGPFCSASQTIAIRVTPRIIINILPSSPVCFGESSVLQASGGNTYNWQPSSGVSNVNDSITTVIPQSVGINVYTVTVTNNGLCPQTQTISILVNPLPFVNAGLDTTINFDESVVIRGTGNVVVGFLAPSAQPLICNFCPIVAVNPTVTTCYILKGTDSNTGCSNTDTMCVKITKDWNIYIPNAFSPNGDFDNEYFMPKSYGLIQIDLLVFDRWGVQIFKEVDTQLGWDGKYKGKLCEEGVYIYQLDYKIIGGLKKKKTGHVTLLSKIK